MPDWLGNLTRRGLLAGLGASVAGRALAEAPLTSVFPVARRLRGGGSGADPGLAEALIAEAKLTGDVVFALADLKSGSLLAARDADRPMPPASTAKAITSLYALHHLGRDHRFETRLLATGPIRSGRIEGDLILAGGGDPTLSTDNLGDMAGALAQAGVKAVSGRFLVWAGALPYLAAIDPGQPDWLGYNPAVGGLNLNFNRVNFTWQKANDGWQVGFDARAERFAPPVNMARMQVVNRDLPVYTYAQVRGTEDWTVSQAALNTTGSRWLPVRRPDLYAGDVFQTLARAQGIDLPSPEVLADAPQGQVLVRHRSDGLPDLLRLMMKYSTNMTAEAVGMAASARIGVTSHQGSAEAMAGWLSVGTGRGDARFVDHSGLGGRARVTAAGMVAALRVLGPQAGLAALMKEVRFKDRGDLGQGRAPLRVVAKTGTLNFVSGLVGYMTTAAGEERAFAIYAADVARRDAVPPDQREDPPGGSGWLKRARRMQLQLLASWA